MKNVIILEASNSIAQDVIDILIEKDEINLTLFLRNKSKLKNHNISKCRIIEGNVLDFNQLVKSIAGQDIVYANLVGNAETMTKNIVKAMDEEEVKKLIFISLIGLNDLPLRPDLNPYQKVAEAILASDLDYTILRPIWYTISDEVEYEINKRGQPEKGTLISQNSLATFITNIIEIP